MEIHLIRQTGTLWERFVSGQNHVLFVGSSPVQDLMEIIKYDKKAIKKWPKFVLIDKIGYPHCPEGQWAVDVQKELVEKILKKLK